MAPKLAISLLSSEAPFNGASFCVSRVLPSVDFGLQGIPVGNASIQALVHIPVNVIADSGNVTGNSGERDRGSVLRIWILCRFVFPAVFPVLNWLVFE